MNDLKAMRDEIKTLFKTKNPTPAQVAKYLTDNGGQARSLYGVDGNSLVTTENQLLQAIGKKVVDGAPKIFGKINWESQDQAEIARQIQVLRFAFLDDVPTQHDKPSFWSKLWEVVKQIAPIIGRGIFNPENGHLAEVDTNFLASKGVRTDRKDLIMPTSCYNLDFIDSSFINCVLNPEFYYARRPSLGYKTSAIRSSMEIPIYVNSSGNGACYVFPQNLLNILRGRCLTDFNAIGAGSGIRAQPQVAFVNRLWDETFNATTGGQGTGLTAATVKIAEPLMSNVGYQAQNFERVVINSVSVEFRPNISLTQSQGLVQMIQWNAPISDGFLAPTNVLCQTTDGTDPDALAVYVSSSGLPQISQASMPLQPYYQVAPLLQSNDLRFAKVFEGQDSTVQLYKQKTILGEISSDAIEFFAPTQVQQSFLGTSQGMYLLITGAQTGTAGLKVGSLTISYAAEGTAVDSLLPIAPPELALPGPATLSAIRNLMLQYPEITYLRGQELHSLCLEISTCKHHDQLMQVISRFFRGKVNKNVQVLVHSADVVSNVRQPDFYMDIESRGGSTYSMLSS